MPKRDSRDLARVLAAKAAADGAAVAKLSSDQAISDEIVGFHAQQAVEKFIKAVLAYHGVEFPRTHDLTELIALVERAELAPIPRESEVEALSPWAGPLRYEDTFLGPLDRAHALQLLAEVRAWASGLIADDAHGDSGS